MAIFSQIKIIFVHELGIVSLAETKIPLKIIYLAENCRANIASRKGVMAFGMAGQNV